MSIYNGGSRHLAPEDDTDLGAFYQSGAAETTDKFLALLYKQKQVREPSQSIRAKRNGLDPARRG